MAPTRKSLNRSTRSALRQQVTKKCKYVDQNIGLLSEAQLFANLNCLTEFKVKLDEINDRILTELWADIENSDEADSFVCDEMESHVKYRDSLNKSMSLIKDKLPKVASAPQQHVGSQLKLPELPLPTFSNKKGDSISKFFREFEAVLDRYNLNTHLKFTLLIKQLHGDPSKLVDSLECSKRSYEDAKKLLEEAFADTLTQQYSVIRQLSELKLTFNKDPYEFISNMRIIINQFDALDINKDLVLQYFIWDGFNDCFRNQMIQVTGKNRPSLKEINDNIFVALERYRDITVRYNERKGRNTNQIQESTNLASAVRTQPDRAVFKECCLCLDEGNKDIDHPIYKCDRYVSSKSKVDKLSNMNHCTRCTSKDHNAANCKFRFYKKCVFCSKWHFSYLCLSKSGSQSKQNGSNSSNVKVKNKSDDTKKTELPSISSSNLVWTESGTLHISCNPVTAMPTFSLNSSGDRAVKDTGSQISFVEENWAKAQKFEVIDNNYKLILNGINSSKPLATSVYKIKFDDKFFVAVAVPSINVKLNLPGIAEVAQAFKDKGYFMGDKYLHLCKDEIKDLRILLGNDNAHLVPQTDVLFGGKCNLIPSVYLESLLGVMLIGDISRYKENLEELPDRNFHSGAASCSAQSFPVENEVLDSNREEAINVGDEEICQSLPVNVDYTILSDNGSLVKFELERATEEILSSNVKLFMNYDTNSYEEHTIEENDKLVDFALDNVTRDSEGRLIFPLLWNGKVAHLLGKNQNLAKAVLRSNFKKYSKQGESLLMIDKAFREQEKLGIIEQVDNLPQFLEENPQSSFLPHMAVFRLDRDTTKCRNVFLSNLCEPNPNTPMTVSHNQAICSGPCLNKKISTSILQLRFDEKVLCFDLQKAFLMIELTPADQSKLLFYWYRNVAKKDFSLITYKNCRLPFGLKCSPTLLMLALYKMLVLDIENDSSEVRELKRAIYNLAYMDNLAYTTNDSEQLNWAYSKLESIFSPYKFGLQQFVTNDSALQGCIDGDKEGTPSQVKLLGILWHREQDKISTRKLFLDKSATTKRKILSTIATNFDVYSFNGPILNRARLFMHRLQCMKDVSWDQGLSNDLLREWANICNQVNSTPEITIKRCVGRRTDPYEELAFCDASKDIYGTVLYIRNLRTNEVNFLLAKNRLIGNSLESKSIPSLELQSICFGTETLMDTLNELCDSSCITPINIVKLQVFSDSAVALSWLNSHINKFDKMRKQSIFVMNRINKIEQCCQTHAVDFRFCAGLLNPADCITRPLSYKTLMKSKYLSGPDCINEDSTWESLSVTIPNPLTNMPIISETNCQVISKDDEVVDELSFPAMHGSSLQRIVSIGKSVLHFVNNVKFRLKQNDPGRYEHFKILTEEEIFQRVYNQIILYDQRQTFPEVFAYFETKKCGYDVPNIITQLNLFIDDFGLIRVKSKFNNLKLVTEYPILLGKCGYLTQEIILEYHRKLAHSGLYMTISELRKRFWIPCHFSVIKKVLKNCIHCRRFNGRNIKLNQSPYRDFRTSPPAVPYRYVFIDFFGPYLIHWEGKRVKAWILCITCLWSRAINLKVCLNLTVASFLRSMQLHSFEFGVPELCLSDQGSQFVAGGKLVEDFLSDRETQAYFAENGIKPLSFQQYYKGHNELGSLVEICVKLTKRLLDCSIRNMILSYLEFEFVVCNVVHLVNRRPVTFKEYLRSDDPNEPLPSAITPEILLKGHELNSLNIIPQLHPLPETDPDWCYKASSSSGIRDNYGKLRKVRESLTNIYNNEFLTKLIDQATDKKSRYIPVTHKALEVGDLVLLKEPLLKPTNFPMGIVKAIETNSVGEVTGATVMKGKSRDITKRHVSSSIPLLYKREYDLGLTCTDEVPITTKEFRLKELKPKRDAAVVSQQRTRELLAEGIA